MEAGIMNHDTIDAARLEEGEVHVLTTPLPFALPSSADQDFLRQQELTGKEIVFEPDANRLEGHLIHSADQSERLRHILHESQHAAHDWLQGSLPYADARPLRTCFHVAEEATRRLRVTARYDLLHIDAIHASGGCRVLRLFVNLNPTDPRVWASSETFAKILPTYGMRSGLLHASHARSPRRFGQDVLDLFRSDRKPVDPYDDFMLEFARYLKHSEEFQEKSPRRIWRFQPGHAWLAFTDGLVHADLRGRWVLDHLFLIPPHACVRPDLTPANLINSYRHPIRAAA